MEKIKQYAKLLGSRGGKQSAKKRFEGLTKEEISAKMRKVRYSKSQIKKIDGFKKDVLSGFKKI